MKHIHEFAKKVDVAGFAIMEGVLSATEVTGLIAAVERAGESESVLRRGGVFAVRNLLDVSPEICALASSRSVRSLVEPVLGPHCFPVRGILFDKIPDANWKVPWHQDVTIAVSNRVEIEGFRSWSIKADVLHVQPPVHILENMLSVRLHLDPCGEPNGPLRVIPGSQKLGRIAEADLPHVLGKETERVCEVGAGGALLMRPLLLHASSPAQAPDHRRVIHLDFAAVPLPGGMRWISEAAL